MIPSCLLPGKRLLPIGVPAVVEFPLVLVRPLLRHLMRRVARPGGEVRKERLVGGHLFGVGDEADRPIRQVLAQVVPFLGRLLRFDPMVVVRQFRVVLVGVAGQKTVVALEAAPQRPPVARSRRRHLVGRGEVPFAERVGVVAVLQQHLREKAVLVRDVAVAARVPRRAFGDARHGIRVVVPPGEDARTGGRAQRRGVHVVVAQAARREAVQVRGLDRAPEAAELPEARVVQDDEQHVGRALSGPQAAPAKPDWTRRTSVR